MKIELYKHELEICENIAKLRNQENEKNNIASAKRSKYTDEEINIIGFIAEFAFCKKFNLFPDFTIFSRSGSYDGKTKSGARYDIKATNKKNGNLVATIKVNKDIDVYILAIVNHTEVEFIGWINKDEFINEKNIKNLGYGDSYFLHRDKLNKF